MSHLWCDEEAANYINWVILLSPACTSKMANILLTLPIYHFFFFLFPPNHVAKMWITHKKWCTFYSICMKGKCNTTGKSAWQQYKFCDLLCFSLNQPCKFHVPTVLLNWLASAMLVWKVRVEQRAGSWWKWCWPSTGHLPSPLHPSPPSSHHITTTKDCWPLFVVYVI